MANWLMKKLLGVLCGVFAFMLIYSFLGNMLSPLGINLSFGEIGGAIGQFKQLINEAQDGFRMLKDLQSELGNLGDLGL